MTSRLRKLTLLAHIIFSVGWLGSVAGFLCLAVTGLTSTNTQIIRAVYLAMEPITWFVIVPLAFASFLTGLLLSLGTQWGLFRHYWILGKLLINLLSIPILLLHTRLIDYMANTAARRDLSHADLSGPGAQLAVAAIAALIVLLVATILSVYKPRGLTPKKR
ncbi:MAG TPA: hypothetical protein VNS58_15770 [Puia sp.]|nr:hypothetical protein [Puia sp.]